MILYLMGDYHFGVAKGTNLIFFWSAATNFMPLLGAFLADFYLGRFLTIALGSISSLSVINYSQLSLIFCRLTWSGIVHLPIPPRVFEDTFVSLSDLEIIWGAGWGGFNYLATHAICQLSLSCFYFFSFPLPDVESFYFLTLWCFLNYAPISVPVIVLSFLVDLKS